ncbi:uncharacterized protein LAJ45_00277 [Morchella importuna]|uniref:Phosphatidylinositol 4-kinase n=1 Tax=Morchella conica CCBAS932 TaxID=1392247 RepID=A0A3N4KMF3_9PEZI|nr:uncharacterized protein LAJ45_00277 [Morchella importuna]KAH8155268.1 hypothetical protein LAJ45_00277 [Morchella importuna]RPB11756.1 hypothetical protein P167DRAFT_574953 [Morchella conica CCBAS932]
MPRPAASGYERLAQDAQFSDSDDDDRDSIVDYPGRVVSIQPHPTAIHPTPYTPISPSVTHHNGRAMKRTRSNSSGVDIKAINARLERWSREIASKFKLKKGRSHHDQPPLEIVYSVFLPPDGSRPALDGTPEASPELPENTHLAQEQFEEIIESVRTAIRKGIDPKLIKQGSSGSYFMRNSDGKIVGVFKPKDEEPYGKLNPKMMKWLHRTLFPCFFGRACLIPNLSYISEAAACVLDRQLRTFLVPYTDIVKLSSKAFHYDYWDRRAYYRRSKPLPPKVGSFQVFLQGFQDANVFLRKHPWPDQYNSGFRTDAAPRRRAPWASACRPSGDEDDLSDGDSNTPSQTDDPNNRRFVWTEQLQQNFREELEKLVILDYIMRNTDRGLDNWMIKVDWKTQEVSVASHPTHLNVNLQPATQTLQATASEPNPAGINNSLRPATPIYRVQEPMVASSRSVTPQIGASATIKIGAIDNSLAFPWKHPDQWRSFPFGWLFLPVSLIGQPFSQKTRNHFIPLLTSTKWWAETQTMLRRLFEQDSDFKERMFQKQIAVLKGQAFNVLETLKTPDQGPLELTRRARVHVWDDEMEVPVAVPLRVPSSESRHRRETDLERGFDEEAEMDIGAAVASAPLLREHDLLGLSPPRSEIPSSARLGMSRTHSLQSDQSGSSSNQNGDILSASPLSAVDSLASKFSLGHEANPSVQSSSMNAPRSSRRSHKSFDERRSPIERKKPGPNFLDQRKRRFSLTSSAGPPRNVYNDDDAEGDLGYSAVDGSEGAQRKVIVERLEAVKSRNPVFTWC